MSDNMSAKSCTALKELYFGIVSRDQLAWSEHSARILEVTESALSIETREPVSPGYVWLKERISGTRGGILEWSRRDGERYCSRIRFVPLTENVEHYVRDRARRKTGRTHPDRSKEDRRAH